VPSLPAVAALVLPLLTGAESGSQHLADHGAPRRQLERSSKPGGPMSQGSGGPEPMTLEAAQRLIASYHRELEEKDAQLRWLRQELEHLRQEDRGPGGLLALFAARLLTPHEDGVVSRHLSKAVTVPPKSALVPNHVTSYRATTERQEGREPLVRVAVAMALRNSGTTSWTLSGASLVGLERVVRIWPPVSLRAGEQQLLFLEAELTVSEARRSFTLELWNEDRTRRVTLHGVTFP
jgi:hypothetical protein